MWNNQVASRLSIKNKLYRVLFASLLPILLVACAGGSQTKPASDPLTAFEQRAATALKVVEKSPDKPPKYGSRSGNKVQQLLDVDELLRVHTYVSSSSVGNTDRMQRFSKAVEATKPVTQSYIKAFKASSGEYDQEFIDVGEFGLHLLLISQHALSQVDMDALELEDNEIAQGVKDMMGSANKLIATLPLAMIKQFDQYIAQNKFSPAYRLEAERRYVRMADSFNVYQRSNELTAKAHCNSPISDSDRRYMESVYTDLFAESRLFKNCKRLKEGGQNRIDRMLRFLRAGLTSSAHEAYVLTVEMRGLQKVQKNKWLSCDEEFADRIQQTFDRASGIRKRLLCEE